MAMQSVKRPTNTQTISASTTSAALGTALKNSDISVYSPDVAVFVKIGYTAPTATTTAGAGYDIYAPAGVRVDFSTGGGTYIAVITASGSGTVYVNEWTHKAL